MSERTVSLQVTRFRPGEDAAPTAQTYEVAYRDDWVVLDALNFIKDHVDPTLAYRWSCRMGVCGSCGMMVNGEPRLTCSAFLREFDGGEIQVEPLAHFPVVRDLVIDMSGFLDKLKRVSPWIIRDSEEDPAKGEYRQSPAQLEAYHQFTSCINCLLCYSACPIFGLETDFIGPAALALTHRYNEDSRDEGSRARWDAINDHDGAWQCTFVGECSVVCPKSVDPAAAIQRLKVQTAKHWVRSILLPWGQK